MKRTCFNCGEVLPINSLKCNKCGYTPDIEFMKKCQNLEVMKCSITGLLCSYRGFYQTCPVKNEVDGDF